MSGNSLCKKGLLFGIITLFIGASILPNINGNNANIDIIKEKTIEENILNSKPFNTFFSEEWNKTFGGRYTDFAYSLQLTNDGGYIMTGVRDFNKY